MLAVADTKYVNGVVKISDNAPGLHLLPAHEAFGAGWQTDAHFVCYSVVGNNQTVFPRLNKPVLPRLRHMGADVHVNILAFDYDNPNHAEWTPELYQVFWGKLQTAGERWPIAQRWSLLYTTKGGARLVYFLAEGVPADKAENKHRWMVNQFAAVGLDLDHLSDWTRLFRLPYVMRDGKPTSEATYGGQRVFFIPRYANRLHGDELGEVQKGQTAEYGEIRHFDDPQPELEDALALLEEVNLETGRKRQSWWLKEAKNRLRGRECFPCLFEHKPLAEEGSRDQTLHKFVGQAIAMLFRLDGTTPAHIYAIFIDPCQQLVPDQGTPDWLKSLWGHIGRLWVREEAKFTAETEKSAQVEETTVATLDKIIQGMRDWCDHPALRADQKTAADFIQGHLIAQTSNTYFVMRPDGYYDEMQLSTSQLIPRIRALGMEQIIETKVVRQDGTGFRDLSPSEITNKHGTVVTFIRGVPATRGGIVENLDTPASVLVLPCFERSPTLVPTWDDEVDMWLRELAGTRYVELCEWISWALAFDEGSICALSLAGAAGAGKKMLARGLAECLRVPKLATAEDLVGDNQYNLLTSPFMHIDEGWPIRMGKGLHPADQFRRLVSGQSFDCNRKFMAPVEVNNPVRIVLTANNLNLIQMLVSNRDLTPEERDSLGVRIKHIVVPERATMWMRMKGGHDFTGRKGRRWIAGDSNQASDFIVAKHFLYLHSIREKCHNSTRFLVDGDMSSELMFEMRTNTGSAPVVIETIIKLLNTNNRRVGLCIQDWRLFILTQEILEFHRQHKTSGTKDLTANTITQVMKNFVVMEHPEPMTLRERPELTKRRWHELDPSFLLKYARRDGWSCPTLERLVEEREKLGWR